MELKTLWYFLAIAERENITQAAHDLHITQPHLTRQLQALETELGVPLFMRDKKRLTITEEGRYFKQQVRQLFALLQKTKDQVRTLHAGLMGKLYIGAIETLSPLYVPSWIRHFQQAYPKVTYQIWTANSQDVLERLDDGLLDVALIRGTFQDDSRYGVLPLLKEGWICLFPDQGPISSCCPDQTLPLSALENQDLIVPSQRSQQIRALFQKARRDAHILCEFSPLINGIVLAEQGLGVAILPASAEASLGGHRVCVRHLAIDEPSQGCLVWRNDLRQTQIARKFIEMIQTIQAAKE